MAHRTPILAQNSPSLPRIRLPPRVLKNSRLPPHHALFKIQLPHHLESPSPLTHALAHDNALANPLNLIPLHMPRGLEQMIGRLLEAGELEHAVAHLGEAEAGDAEDLALVGHDIGEQLHVAGVDVHGAHDEADLVDDGLARGLDAEHVARLHDGVGPRREPVDALRRHAVAEAVAFDQESIEAGVVGFDDGARGVGVAADGDVGQDALDEEEAEEELRVFFRRGFGGDPLGAALVLVQGLDVDADQALVTADVVVGQLEFLLLDDRVDNVSGRDA